MVRWEELGTQAKDYLRPLFAEEAVAQRFVRWKFDHRGNIWSNSHLEGLKPKEKLASDYQAVCREGRRTWW